MEVLAIMEEELSVRVMQAAFTPVT